MANKTPNYDAKIKTILDGLEPGERVCALTGEKWIMDEEEIGWYKKFNVPPSKISPNTRWKLLSYYDSAFQFWWNKHFDTGEPILSFHHPGSGIRVLPDKEWHDRDFSHINIDYDSSRPFFEQMRELEVRVPFQATNHAALTENSISINSLGDTNSYFVFGCRSKNTFHSTVGVDVEDCSLLYGVEKANNCHYVLHSQRLHNCRYIRESYDCIDCAFLFDCRNCKNCFGAVNKRNKEFLFFNEQLSEDEYKKRISEIDLGKRSVVEQYSERFEDLIKKEAIWPTAFNEKTTNSTGDYLTGSVNCSQCFYSEGDALNNYRCAWYFGKTEGNAVFWSNVDANFSYFCGDTYFSNNIKFCARCIGLDDCEYCITCHNCQNCFGCAGLKRKQFCIFNKQYSEEEYWEKVDQIKSQMLERGEYGQFFPAIFSGTYVPESGPILYCGATAEQVKQIGGNEFDVNAFGATSKTEVDPDQVRYRNLIPDSIDDLDDSWVGVPIMDEVANRTFAFLKPELEHYRRLRIAPPTTHFIRRLHEVSFTGQMAALEDRACAECEQEVMTSYSMHYPDRKVYCRECYLNYLEQYG